MPLQPVGPIAGTPPAVGWAIQPIIDVLTGTMIDQPVTLADGLTVKGGYTASGGMTVLGGASIHGGLTASGGASVYGGLTVSSGNLTVSSGIAVLSSGLTVQSGGATVSSGDINVSAGNIFASGTVTSSQLLTGSSNMLVSGVINSATITKLSGDATQTNTAGYAYQIFSGQAFHDQFATQLNYRCGGSSTETGQARTWLTVSTPTGAAQFQQGALTVSTAQGIPAGGTASFAVVLGATPFGLYAGSGVPTLIAAKGSLYLRSDGTGTTSRAYIATASAGSSSVWTPLTTAS